jgi:hypothetical protein
LLRSQVAPVASRRAASTLALGSPPGSFSGCSRWALAEAAGFGLAVAWSMHPDRSADKNLGPNGPAVSIGPRPSRTLRASPSACSRCWIAGLTEPPPPQS